MTEVKPQLQMPSSTATNAEVQGTGDPLLTIAEVGAMLKKSRRTIEHWVDAGYLTCIRIQRSVLFEREQVLADLRRFSSAKRD
jgi:excisionase family DNA binding protein